MSAELAISLPTDLIDFINANAGPGKPFPTVSELISDALRERRDRMEAKSIRAAIIEGYQDAIAGRMHTYEGDLRALMRRVSPR